MAKILEIIRKISNSNMKTVIIGGGSEGLGREMSRLMVLRGKSPILRSLALV